MSFGENLYGLARYLWVRWNIVLARISHLEAAVRCRIRLYSQIFDKLKRFARNRVTRRLGKNLPKLCKSGQNCSQTNKCLNIFIKYHFPSLKSSPNGKIRPIWSPWPGTTSLLYLPPSQVSKKNKFYNLGSRPCGAASFKRS